MRCAVLVLVLAVVWYAVLCPAGGAIMAVIQVLVVLSTNIHV